MPLLRWVAADSSVFFSVAYLQSERTLYLHFRTGEIYRYFAVPPEEYRAFLAAESKGKYFAANIRDQYVCERLPRARARTASASD